MKTCNEIASIPKYAAKNMRGLKKLRQRLGINATILSLATGVSTGSIAHYELYGRLPLRENYNKLADYFSWKIWRRFENEGKND